MMAGVETALAVRNIYKLATEIYQCIKQVDDNQGKCLDLAESIHIVVEAIADIDTTLKKYEKGIVHLEKALRECSVFIYDYSHSWRATRYLRSEANARKFDELDKTILRAQSHLNLHIAVHRGNEQSREFKSFRASIEMMERKLDAMVIKLGKSSSHEIKEEKGKFPLPFELRIPFSALTLKKEIGKGRATTVYLGKWQGAEVAVKLLKHSFSESEKLEFQREIQVLSRLSNPFIIRFFGACLEEKTCLVMKYFPLGSLEDYPKKTELPVLQKSKIADNIVNGLQFLHNNGIIHNNLCGSNILLTQDLQARISGFNLFRSLIMTIDSVDKPLQLTDEPCAPELIQGEKPTEATDIYALGKLFYEIFTGKRPTTLSEKNLTLNPDIPAEWQQIIRDCWAEDPKHRPSLDHLKSLIKKFNRAEKLYIEGSHAERGEDYKTAFAKYSKAKDDSTDALASYAQLLLFGQGVEQNQLQAYQLMLAAAELGLRRAVRNVGVQLDNGWGTLKDQRQAMIWYRRAGEAGDQECRDRAKHIEEKLPFLAVLP